MKWKNLIYPHKIYHALKIEYLTCRTIVSYGLPDVMPQFLGGIGDELLLTCVAREFKKRNSKIKIWQVSSAAELLKQNPDYSHVFNMEYWYLRYSGILKYKRRKLRYSEPYIKEGQEIPPIEHILARLCRAAGIRGEIEVRPYYYQTEGERSAGRIHERQICIQSIGEFTHETWMKNKLWFHSRFQKVVSELLKIYPGIKIIQLGVLKDHSLSGAIDLRGKTTLRETAAILSNSLGFIGTSGLLAHLARATECRSVIIYGGREHSWQTGYTCNENLDSFVECSPCWKWNQCDFTRKCMNRIRWDHVLEATHNIIRKKGLPLETHKLKII